MGTIVATDWDDDDDDDDGCVRGGVDGPRDAGASVTDVVEIELGFATLPSSSSSSSLLLSESLIDAKGVVVVDSCDVDLAIGDVASAAVA